LLPKTAAILHPSRLLSRLCNEFHTDEFLAGLQRHFINAEARRRGGIRKFIYSRRRRQQYNLGYTPDRTELAGYHKIHLATKQKDLVVRAREGYYADR